MAKNPPWTRDELILALDLYFRHNPLHISKTHPEVIALSDLLNALPIFEERPDEEHFRNENGVYMKLCNFLRLDPDYEGAGLTRGGRLEEEVWDLTDDQRIGYSSSYTQYTVTSLVDSIPGLTDSMIAFGLANGDDGGIDTERTGSSYWEY